MKGIGCIFKYAYNIPPNREARMTNNLLTYNKQTSPVENYSWKHIKSIKNSGINICHLTSAIVSNLFWLTVVCVQVYVVLLCLILCSWFCWIDDLFERDFLCDFGEDFNYTLACLGWGFEEEQVALLSVCLCFVTGNSSWLVLVWCGCCIITLFFFLLLRALDKIKLVADECDYDVRWGLSLQLLHPAFCLFETGGWCDVVYYDSWQCVTVVPRRSSIRDTLLLIYRPTLVPDFWISLDLQYPISQI